MTMDNGTLEGRISTLLQEISGELTGVIEYPFWTVPAQHIYPKRINYLKGVQQFEIDSVHLKTFCAKTDEDLDVDLKTINAAMKAVLGPSFDRTTYRLQTTATLDHPELQKAFDGARQVRVHKYLISVKDFPPAEFMN